MNFQPPDHDDPRTDAEREEDADREHAEMIGLLSASRVAPGEAGYAYINDKTEPPFQPHPWVVRAIVTALETGREQGRRAVEAEQQLLSIAMEEKFTTRETNLIGSTIIGIMEAANLNTVELTSEQARTCSDRWELKYQLVGNDKIHIYRVPKGVRHGQT